MRVILVILLIYTQAFSYAFEKDVELHASLYTNKVFQRDFLSSYYKAFIKAAGEYNKNAQAESMPLLKRVDDHYELKVKNVKVVIELEAAIKGYVEVGKKKKKYFFNNFSREEKLQYLRGFSEKEVSINFLSLFITKVYANKYREQGPRDEFEALMFKVMISLEKNFESLSIYYSPTFSMGANPVTVNTNNMVWSSDEFKNNFEILLDNFEKKASYCREVSSDPDELFATEMKGKLIYDEILKAIGDPKICTDFFDLKRKYGSDFVLNEIEVLDMSLSMEDICGKFYEKSCEELYPDNEEKEEECAMKRSRDYFNMGILNENKVNEANFNRNLYKAFRNQIKDFNCRSIVKKVYTREIEEQRQNATLYGPPTGPARKLTSEEQKRIEQIKIEISSKLLERSLIEELLNAPTPQERLEFADKAQELFIENKCRPVEDFEECLVRKSTYGREVYNLIRDYNVRASTLQDTKNRGNSKSK